MQFFNRWAYNKTAFTQRFFSFFFFLSICARSTKPWFVLKNNLPVVTIDLAFPLERYKVFVQPTYLPDRSWTASSTEKAWEHATLRGGFS